MKRILKYILIFLAIAVVAGLIAWLVWAKGWPWWVGVALFLGVMGLWISFLFVRRYLLRRKERAFVQRVIAQDQAAIQAAPIHERQQLQDLQRHWMESVERLRGSRLRKRGNPLYVLPWYLVLGESGTGKSSTIKNANLSSPLTDTSRGTGIAATRNCDWWFFEQAVILDTAGRYTIAIDEAADRQEWEKFLSLLAKYRRREPLNGVVVTVSADKLAQAGDSKLREDGLDIRRHVDQLMRIIGSKFPIYVMITKMDLVHGMADFCAPLPEDRIAQAMGYTNEQLNPYWKEVLEQGMESIAGRLRELRFALVHRAEDIAPGALLFPNEFLQLRSGLESFLQPIFEENPYQETPLFRGLYGSSSRQGDPAASEFMRMFGLEAKPARGMSRERGLFLTNFFRTVLPRDRYLYRPLPEYLKWRRIVTNMGLLAWVLVWAGLCGVLSLSFVLNLRAIRGFTEDFYNPPSLQQKPAVDLLMLERMRNEINEMEAANRDWWIPRFGLDQSLRVEKQVRDHFIDMFRNGFLLPLDATLRHKIDQVTPATPEDLMVDYVGYVVTRINLIHAYLRGEKENQANPEVLRQFKEASGDLIQLEYADLPPEIANKFGDIYYSYLYWFGHRSERLAMVSVLQDQLLRLLKQKGPDMHWLVLKWIPGAPPVRLSDFWTEPEKEIPDAPEPIPGAFTAAGRQNITDFLLLLENALADPQQIAHRKAEFWSWYRDQFNSRWADFAQGFNAGRDGLESSSGWQEMASEMTTGQNPYFSFLQRLAVEIRAQDDPAPMPWAEEVLQIDEVIQLAKDEEAKKKAQSTMLAKIEQQKTKLEQTIRKTIGEDTAKELEVRLAAAKIWEDYLANLQKIAPAAISRETAFNMVCEYFPDKFSPDNTQNPDSKSPFNLAYSDVLKMAGVIQGKTELNFVWELVAGPLRFLVDYTILETACVLQEQWQSQVLGGLHGATADNVPKLLFDKTDGLVWKFLSGTAKPFVTRDRNGYRPSEVFERSIPFHGEFFDFVNAGAAGMVNLEDEYTVKLETIPIDVNEDARSEPFACLVCLQCGDGQQCLENYNFPQSAVFKWAPDKCGEVTLAIQLPALTLKRVYPGKLGFPRFCSEFLTGSQVFRAEDFPESTEQLHNLGIHWIKVSFRITGAGPVIQTLRRAPPQPPSAITSCWSD